MSVAVADLVCPGTAASSAAAESRRPAILAVMAWLRDLMLSVLIAVLVVLFLYRPVKVEGTSMMPTLYDQERLFINQFSYKFGLGPIQRGDTVVFWVPGELSTSYIKRVIGLPGDTVAVENGYVILNGKKLAEKYVPPEFRDNRPYPPTVVPPGQYFVLGDDRISSNDSRAWGFVPRNLIYGKAVFVFWPLERIGTVR
ncbi:MAG: signal peptidase I [Acidobacteriaceae bacterium]|nr:signal peptidase I [Acidobacteriaceae bacterium]MBV8572052.1 signal peptidase I [Acidobacteriaceae bacterium]